MKLVSEKALNDAFDSENCSIRSLPGFEVSVIKVYV